jgi:hypothetical protein
MWTIINEGILKYMNFLREFLWLRFQKEQGRNLRNVGTYPTDYEEFYVDRY